MNYEDSTLDVKKILAYAKRVASETQKPLQPPLGVEWHEETKIVTEIVERKWFFGLLTFQQTISRPETQRFSTQKLGPHWVIHSRDSHFKSNKTEYSAYYIWVLLPDGQLKYIVKTEEFFTNRANRIEPKYELSVTDMTDGQMLSLDHQAPRYEYASHEAGEPGRAWGNHYDGTIGRHAKGVGISLLLKNLLESS